MANNEHLKQLQTIATEYASEVFVDLATKMQRDGFQRDGDTGPLMGMTVAALISIVLQTIHDAHPPMVEAHREHLIKHIERSRVWLK